MEKIVKHIPMKKRLAETEEISRVLYFDIETTGLSAGRSMIYMIGMAYYKNEGYEIVQLFANQAVDEALVIREFLSILRQYQVTVSFNGDQFDMPFIRKRMQYLELDEDMGEWESLDIYKIVRKHEKHLHLENGKQKTVEAFLGMNRQDKYSGGELIDVYRKYLITREQALYDCLLLHNFEDVLGLIQITDILSYCAIFEGKWEFMEWNTIENGIEVQCRLEHEVPVEWICALNDGELKAKQKILLIRLYSQERELKLFYKDYKNYYYLPLEDTAMHKSVAGFVDKEYRMKATKENCYTKCNLPVIRNYGAEGFHDLQETYQSKEKYVSVKELHESGMNQPEVLKEFLLKCLNYTI